MKHSKRRSSIIFFSFKWSWTPIPIFFNHKNSINGIPRHKVKMNTYSWSCFVNLKIIVRTFANMVGPLGPPKNYAAFRPHKGRTKFLCDYNTVNEQSLLQYDNISWSGNKNVSVLDYSWWGPDHYLGDDAYACNLKMLRLLPSQAGAFLGRPRVARLTRIGALYAQ